MANPEHVALVRSRDESIDLWAEGFLDGADYGLDLSGADLAGADLSGLDLTGADLSSANLCGANLRKATLEATILRGGVLSHADLRDADLQLADLENAELCGADLRGALFHSAGLCGTDLSASDLRGARFGKISSDFFGPTVLCSANLMHADLTGVDFENSNLSLADLRGARIEGANLGSAHLGGAILDESSGAIRFKTSFPPEPGFAPAGLIDRPDPKPAQGLTVGAPPPQGQAEDPPLDADPAPPPPPEPAEELPPKADPGSPSHSEPTEEPPPDADPASPSHSEPTEEPPPDADPASPPPPKPAEEPPPKADPASPSPREPAQESPRKATPGSPKPRLPASGGLSDLGIVSYRLEIEDPGHVLLLSLQEEWIEQLSYGGRYPGGPGPITKRLGLYFTHWCIKDGLGLRPSNQRTLAPGQVEIEVGGGKTPPGTIEVKIIAAERGVRIRALNSVIDALNQRFGAAKIWEELRLKGYASQLCGPTGLSQDEVLFKLRGEIAKGRFLDDVAGELWMGEAPDELLDWSRIRGVLFRHRWVAGITCPDELLDWGRVRGFQKSALAARSVRCLDDEAAITLGLQGDVRIWELATGGLRSTFSGHRGVVTTWCRSIDRGLLITGGMDSTVRLWSLESGASLWCGKGHKDGVVMLDVDRAFGTAVSIDPTGIMRVWDVASGRCRREIDTQRKKYTREGDRERWEDSAEWRHHGVRVDFEGLRAFSSHFALYSPLGGEYLTFYANIDRCWSLDSGELLEETRDDDKQDSLRDIRGPTLRKEARGFEFIHTGGRKLVVPVEGDSSEGMGLLCRKRGIAFISSGDGTIRAYSFDDGAPGPILIGHQTKLRSLDVDREERFLVSRDQDGTVLVWDLPEGRQRARLHIPVGGIDWISGCPGAEAIILVATSEAGVQDLNVYRLPEAKPLRTFRIDKGEAHSLSISPGRRFACYLAADGEPRVVRLQDDDHGD